MNVNSQLRASVVDKMRQNEKAMTKRIDRTNPSVLIDLQHVLQQTDKLAPINHVSHLIQRLRERSHIQLQNIIASCSTTRFE